MAAQTYVPVIDIDPSQVPVDFATMKATGVEGVYIEAGVGARPFDVSGQDSFTTSYQAATAAGCYAPSVVGAYWYVNPKESASGHDQGQLFGETVSKVRDTPSIVMLDIEDYVKEPHGTNPVLRGSAYEQWLTDFDTGLRAAIHSDSVVIAYSSETTWQDYGLSATIAATWDFMVPRYPIYPPDGQSYSEDPLPDSPSGWAEWALAWIDGTDPVHTKKPPEPPAGRPWAGWQFSADGNGQGKRYGCSSSDVDLNIVIAAYWAKWQYALAGA